jgi:hypothetical protein
LTETATSLTALLVGASALEGSSAVIALIEDTEAIARGLVSQLFIGVGLIVLLTAPVVLA